MHRPSDKVQRLFPQVFANGYVPIPNLDKRCMLKGWPSVAVTERQVRLWARSGKWPAIGLRVAPPLIVIDVDVLDAGLADEIASMAPPGALRRIGKAPKVAFFLRFAGDAFHRIATRRWAPDVSVAKPQWSAVEVFAGGGGGKQFGAFGPHKTDDKTGEVLSWYDWPDGRSPANARLDSLPVITFDAVLHIVNTAEALFKERGWHFDEYTRGGEHKVEHVFDLTPEMVFRGDGVDYDLASLESAARAARVKDGRQIKVTGSFTGDRFSEGSLRCNVSISRFDRVCVHDFKTGRSHHPVDAQQTIDDGSLADILKMMEAFEQ
jgi:hypothetical protein